MSNHNKNLINIKTFSDQLLFMKQNNYKLKIHSKKPINKNRGKINIKQKNKNGDKISLNLGLKDSTHTFIEDSEKHIPQFNNLEELHRVSQEKELEPDVILLIDIID